MEADIVYAAERAPVKARWTPEEKKGLMKASSHEPCQVIETNRFIRTTCVSYDPEVISGQSSGLVAVIAGRLDLAERLGPL